MNEKIKRATTTAAATAAILLTTAAMPAHASPSPLADNTTLGGLGFLHSSAESLITLVNQVLV